MSICTSAQRSYLMTLHNQLCQIRVQMRTYRKLPLPEQDWAPLPNCLIYDTSVFVLYFPTAKDEHEREGAVSDQHKLQGDRDTSVESWLLTVLMHGRVLQAAIGTVMDIVFCTDRRGCNH